MTITLAAKTTSTSCNVERERAYNAGNVAERRRKTNTHTERKEKKGKNSCHVTKEEKEKKNKKKNENNSNTEKYSQIKKKKTMLFSTRSPPTSK